MGRTGTLRVGAAGGVQIVTLVESQAVDDAPNGRAVFCLTRHLQSLAQRGNVARAEIAVAVDEDRRRAVDAIRRTALHVSLHAFRRAAGLELRAQRSGIDARLGPRRSTPG